PTSSGLFDRLECWDIGKFLAYLFSGRFNTRRNINVNHARNVARKLQGAFVEEKNPTGRPAEAPEKVPEFENDVLACSSLFVIGTIRHDGHIVWSQQHKHQINMTGAVFELLVRPMLGCSCKTIGSGS